MWKVQEVFIFHFNQTATIFLTALHLEWSLIFGFIHEAEVTPFPLKWLLRYWNARPTRIKAAHFNGLFCHIALCLELTWFSKHLHIFFFSPLAPCMKWMHLYFLLFYYLFVELEGNRPSKLENLNPLSQYQMGNSKLCFIECLATANIFCTYPPHTNRLKFSLILTSQSEASLWLSDFVLLLMQSSIDFIWFYQY